LNGGQPELAMSARFPAQIKHYTGASAGSWYFSPTADWNASDYVKSMEIFGKTCVIQLPPISYLLGVCPSYYRLLHDKVAANGLAHVHTHPVALTDIDALPELPA